MIFKTLWTPAFAGMTPLTMQLNCQSSSVLLLSRAGWAT